MRINTEVQKEVLSTPRTFIVRSAFRSMLQYSRQISSLSSLDYIKRLLFLSANIMFSVSRFRETTKDDKPEHYIHYSGWDSSSLLETQPEV